jgi:hypothetical protein
MSDKTERPRWLELERVLPLTEIEEITSLSPDSVRRHHRDKLIHISPRRLGMKLKDVLAITNGMPAANADRGRA